MRTLPLLLVALWCVQPGEIRAASPLQTPDLTPIYHATVVISDTSADPITQADALVSDDVRAVLANRGRVDALATAKSDYEASQAKLKTDRAARDALLDPLAPVTPTPGPGPGPVATHVVSILAITDTATCAPCRILQPVLNKLVAQGVPITYSNPNNSTDPNSGLVAKVWGTKSNPPTPTLIMLVDNVEVLGGTAPANTRVTGWSQNENLDLKAWWDSAVTWTNNKYPPTPPKAEPKAER